MKPDPKALYHPLILEHNKSPFNFEKQENAAILLDAYNPICGDRFKLFLNIKDSHIETIHFHGYGCAVSKASTSIMVQKLLGKSIEEAQQICKTFQQTMDSGKSDEMDFIPFAVARQFPGRAACAELSWNYMEEELNKH